MSDSNLNPEDSNLKSDEAKAIEDNQSLSQATFHRSIYAHVLDMWLPGTKEYEEAEKDLLFMEKSNPSLFWKIVSGD